MQQQHGAAPARAPPLSERARPARSPHRSPGWRATRRARGRYGRGSRASSRRASWCRPRRPPRRGCRRRPERGRAPPGRSAGSRAERTHSRDAGSARAARAACGRRPSAQAAPHAAAPAAKQRERRTAALAEARSIARAPPRSSAITTMSKRPNGTGSRPGFSRASQLRVKLGTIRPPISVISMITTASPTRVLYVGRAGEMRFEMECDVAGREQADQQRPPSGCCQLRARDDLARRGGGDQQQEAAVDRQRGKPADRAGERHRERARRARRGAASISGLPCSGRRPVQFGIAVSRKPVTTAGT